MKGNPMFRLFAWALIALAAFSPLQTLAGPADDANAVVDKWSATYSSNDTDALLKLYAPDGVLLGTRGEGMSVGAAGLQTYFSRLRGSGNKNRIVERRTIVLNDGAVTVLGLYEFSIMRDGKLVPSPARFTFVVINRGGQWLIAHHHSSPHVLPK